MLIKWAEDVEFEEITNSKWDGKQKGSREVRCVGRKLNEIHP